MIDINADTSYSYVADTTVISTRNTAQSIYNGQNSVYIAD